MTARPRWWVPQSPDGSKWFLRDRLEWLGELRVEWGGVAWSPQCGKWFLSTDMAAAARDLLAYIEGPDGLQSPFPEL